MRLYPSIILIALFFFSSCSSRNQPNLPILGHRYTEEREVNGHTRLDTIYQTIPVFEFTNQEGAKVTNANFNQIYIADFFFTSCTTICPPMHQNMLQLYNKYKENPAVKILSHSIDPKHDTADVLKKYANNLGVKGTMWQFVYGPQDSIYKIAESYLIAAHDDDEDPQGKVHQGWFILIDPDKRIRGAYDGTDKEQVNKLMNDVDILLSEYKIKH